MGISDKSNYIINTGIIQKRQLVGQKKDKTINKTALRRSNVRKLREIMCKIVRNYSERPN